LDGNSNYQITQ
jgi:hypothetical protein